MWKDEINKTISQCKYIRITCWLSVYWSIHARRIQKYKNVDIQRQFSHCFLTVCFTHNNKSNSISIFVVFRFFAHLRFIIKIDRYFENFVRYHYRHVFVDFFLLWHSVFHLQTNLTKLSSSSILSFEKQNLTL